MSDASGDLNQKMREVRALADAKGFSSDPARIWEMLALIHSEVSEATDAYKKVSRWSTSAKNSRMPLSAFCT